LLGALYLTYDSCFTPIIDKTVCLENQTQLGSNHWLIIRVDHIFRIVLWS